MSSPQGSDKKRPRRVVFKKQNYHSVYEYPKEMVALSPAYSEPQMHAWERSFDGHMRLLNQKHDASSVIGDAADDDDDDMDMFMVSSSTRPFHGGGGGGGGGGRGASMKIGGSQFNAQCHTWPTSDTEFSWSQIQVGVENDVICKCLKQLITYVVLGENTGKHSKPKRAISFPCLFGHADQMARELATFDELRNGHNGRWSAQRRRSQSIGQRSRRIGKTERWKFDV